MNVGTIEKRKNVLSIIKAIKEIDTKLVVIGKKTAYFTEINTYILENNLQNKVIFLENVELKELAAIYKIATVFIYPSVFEGFGIPIIEALYSKTPVISSKGGCFLEAGGENSIYINALNPEEFCSRLGPSSTTRRAYSKLGLVGTGLNWLPTACPLRKVCCAVPFFTRIFTKCVRIQFILTEEKTISFIN